MATASACLGTRVIEVQRRAPKRLPCEMESEAGFPPLTLAFHARADIPAGLVRKILVNDVGLSVEEAEGLALMEGW